jgi:hypothetical protein
MLLFIPKPYTTLSTLIFLLDPLSKSEFLSFFSYPFKQTKKGRGEWESSVPEIVAEEIIGSGLFGFLAPKSLNI